MNIWGFHKEFLPIMNAYFEEFLRGIAPDDVKAECLLPVMVSDFLGKGTLRVRAISSPDRWFGITYQADREAVMAELKLLHRRGIYPPSLYES